MNRVLTSRLDLAASLALATALHLIFLYWMSTDRLATTLGAAATKSGKSLDDVRRAQQAQIPAGRFGNPEEFGAICAFLCSVHAGYMTGQNVLADGGAYPGTF